MVADTECLRDETLQAMIDGSLPQAEADRAEAHLDGCAACRQVFAEALRQTADLRPSDPDARSRAAAGAAALSRGTVVGRYLLLRVLGAGGMGLVYEAYDPDLDRKVALKLLRPRPDESPAEADERGARMRRESQAMAKLSHPNVVPVFDVGQWQGRVFIAMELVDGSSLDQWLAARPRSTAEVLRAFLQAGEGLSAAHGAGLIHRDFKPANVLIGADGRVRVTDFGTARMLGSPGPLADPAAAEPADAAPGDERGAPGGFDGPAAAAGRPPGGEPARAGRAIAFDAQLTSTRALLGSPAYMAPEQLRGEPADARADQFAFCVSLYEALCRARPFAGDTLEQLKSAVEAGVVARPTPGARVPAWLRDVVLRGLRPRAGDRFASMEALLHALRRDPWRRLRRALAAGAVAAAVIAALGLSWRATRQRAASCLAGKDQLAAQVWNPEARERLRTVLAGTGTIDAFDALSKELDVYAKSWADEYEAACLATYVRGEQSQELFDLKMECLAERRASIASRLEAVQRDPATAAVRASLAAVLDPFARCDDARDLRSRVRPRSKDEQSKEQAVDRLLEESVMHLRLAQPGPALQKARDAVAIADAAGFAPAQARAHRAASLVLAAAGDRPGALRALHLSLKYALASEDGVRIAEACSGLARLEFLHGRWQQALDWTELAVTAAARTTQARQMLSNHRMMTVVCSAELGRPGEARAAALQMAAETEGVNRARWVAHWALGVAELAAGNLDAADEQFRAFLEIARRERYQVTDGHHDLGRVALRRRDPAQAALLFGEAIAARERVYGPLNPEVGQSLAGLADALASQGLTGQALQAVERALAIASRESNVDEPTQVYAWTTQGAALVGAGRAAQALAPLERALGSGARLELPPLRLAETRLQLARALGALGRDPERARTLAERARDGFAQGPQDPLGAQRLQAATQLAGQLAQPVARRR